MDRPFPNLRLSVTAGHRSKAHYEGSVHGCTDQEMMTILQPIKSSEFITFFGIHALGISERRKADQREDCVQEDPQPKWNTSATERAPALEIVPDDAGAP